MTERYEDMESSLQCRLFALPSCWCLGDLAKFTVEWLIRNERSPQRTAMLVAAVDTILATAQQRRSTPTLCSSATDSARQKRTRAPSSARATDRHRHIGSRLAAAVMEGGGEDVLSSLQRFFHSYQNLFVALQFLYVLALFLTHNLRFQLIGLTGGIASGKSTASRYLINHHRLAVVDLDRISKSLTATKNAPMLLAIRREFGDGVFDTDGLLDRTALGKQVWADKQRRGRLNALYRWPLLRAWVVEVARVAWWRRGGVVVLDVPLLYETGMWRACRETVCVYCDEATQLKRLMARDGIDEQLARSKVASQWSLDDKKRRSDVVIDNSDTEEQLKVKLDVWLKWRRERPATWKEWLTPSVPCVVVSLLFWMPVWIAYGSWWLSQQWLQGK